MKVYPFKIPKPSNERLIVQVDKDAVFYDKLHQHEEIQLSFIVKGSGNLIVGNGIHAYKAGDFFILGSNLPHLFRSANSDGDSHMISVFFSEDSLGVHFFEIPDLQSVKSLLVVSQGGLSLKTHKEEVSSLMQRIGNAHKLERVITFLQLLQVLSLAETNILSGFVYPKAISANEGRRLQVVYDYVVHNFHEDLQLKAVAALAFMTPNAFCRFFKQRTNKTFFEFLLDVRIAHACGLLTQNRKMGIAAIAHASGFNSISNFNRIFKKIKNCTPTEYRKAQPLLTF